MNKEAAVQPAKDEVKAAAVATPVVEKKAPVIAEAAPAEAKKQVATAAAVKKVAAKPLAVKKAVTEMPAPTPKTPAKPVKKAPAAAKEKLAEAPKAEKVAKEKLVEAPKAEKTAKVKKQAPKKPKLVRDSFTIPETDYALFASLKQRALSAGIEVKKGEILRAALVSLARLDDAELAKAIGLVERIKTGRPKK